MKVSDDAGARVVLDIQASITEHIERTLSFDRFATPKRCEGWLELMQFLEIATKA